MSANDWYWRWGKDTGKTEALWETADKWKQSGGSYRFEFYFNRKSHQGFGIDFA